jgi:uncharacterized protein (TIGR00251 family)
VLSINETAAGVSFGVRIQPRAKRDTVLGELGGALKISLVAPPVDGRANKGCISFIAELLEVRPSQVSILSGHASRNKVMRVAGITAASLRERLERVK